MSSLCEGEREGLCHEISCCLDLDSPISLYFLECSELHAIQLSPIWPLLFFFLSLSCLFLTASVQVFFF